MSEIQHLLRALKRPGLLVRAARYGVTDYNRDRHLRRILNSDATPGPVEATLKLLELEQIHDEKRRCCDASYSVRRHIDVLCALMAEAKFAQANVPQRLSA